jgi:hypothetical protein
MVAVYEPVVPAAVCFEFEVVGLAEVPQHTPLSVIVSPPSEVTLPFPVADVVPILEAAEVVTVGAFNV